jgi:hypothetical protein
MTFDILIYILFNCDHTLLKLIYLRIDAPNNFYGPRGTVLRIRAITTNHLQLFLKNE